jgi:hypothetical protein
MTPLRLPGIDEAEAVRYFSLGRHALVAGLRALGIGAGQSVLLPEYICRDLLAAVHAVGARVAFYPVNRGLCPAIPQEKWPAAAAVLAVDYFGFPQPLEPFRAYSARTGAALIEDNAHGFLSRDESGTWLGLRGDIGIFSLRKTFLLPNGAALIVRRDEAIKRLDPQCAFSGTGRVAALGAKRMLRRLPVIGPFAAGGATRLARGLRQMRTGHAIAPPALDAELQIPDAPEPYDALLHDLERCDFAAETERRRTLYLEFAGLLGEWEIEPVFASLPANTCPYGFPFRADEMRALKVRNFAERRGLDAIRWPDLPDAVAPDAPEHYRHTWLVNFLW